MSNPYGDLDGLGGPTGHDLFPTTPGDLRADLERARERLAAGEFDHWPPSAYDLGVAFRIEPREAREHYAAEQDAGTPWELGIRDLPATRLDRLILGLAGIAGALTVAAAARASYRKWARP